MNIAPLLSFFAGVASVSSPCVLPLIPLVIGYSILEKKLSQTILFTLGFFSVFTIIILLTALFTAAINAYIYYFRIIAAVVIILIGIYFILGKNAFNFSFKPMVHGNKNINSFLMGFLTSLAWSPCYGAYLISVIAYSASSGDIVYSILNLILFSAGFSFTIFVLGLISSKMNLEIISKYSKYISIVSGAIILIAGIYMLLELI
ncbi:cytochrome c biogenesis CcdA family protein [Methanobacterium sp. ACI-7]|uniref:cytochrome c biogenesis CcdA family protein n=1 Tax=unclassified Methanobacterium TaxID=2627676 RepID=UPI0039C2917C